MNIGIDILEIKRMPINNSFIKRFFTKAEITKNINKDSNNNFQKQKYFASLWTLKEAIYKALPQEKISFNKINIVKNQFGQPTVKIKNYEISLSLSHNESTVVAVAIATNYSLKR